MSADTGTLAIVLLLCRKGSAAAGGSTLQSEAWLGMHPYPDVLKWRKFSQNCHELLKGAFEMLINKMN